MKRMFSRIMTAVLILTLFAAQGAFAEDELLKGIFEQLVAEDSAYSRNKAEETGYLPGCTYTEIFEGDSFTILIKGGSFGDGTYTFVRDGDYVKLKGDVLDLYTTALSLDLLKAAGAYYGLNPGLVNGYVTALNLRGLVNKNYMQTVAPGNQFEFWVYIAGPLDMQELDEMVLTEEDAMMYVYEPLGEYRVQMSLPFGKVVLATLGSKESCTLLIGEYGGLDDTALQDAAVLVSALQPDGWEAFASGCTELTAAETPEYTVTLDPDEDTVRSLLEDPPEGYSYAVVQFGSGE